jgi:hypothetical protein
MFIQFACNIELHLADISYSPDLKIKLRDQEYRHSIGSYARLESRSASFKSFEPFGSKSFSSSYRRKGVTARFDCNSEPNHCEVLIIKLLLKSDPDLRVFPVLPDLECQLALQDPRNPAQPQITFLRDPSPDSYIRSKPFHLVQCY